MGPPTRGGWVGAARSTSTGGAQGLASRSVPVALTGTAPTPSTTATVTPTTNNGRSDYAVKSSSGAQTICAVLINFPTLTALH